MVVIVVIAAGWVQADTVLLNEDWESGSFATNGWAAQGHVGIHALGVNDVARFYWSPRSYNYEFVLTSTSLDGSGYASVSLDYDIYSDHFSKSTVEEFSVSVYDGSLWQQVAHYVNRDGDFSWTHESIDITSYASTAADTLQLEFCAYGMNSYNINWWYLDNIQVSGIPVPVPGAALLGLLGLSSAAGWIRRHHEGQGV